MQKVNELLYDCKVFFCKFKREPVKIEMYEKIYYEIVHGLQTVTVSLNKDGMGIATVSMFLPLATQNFDKNKVLIAYNIESLTNVSNVTSQEYVYWYDTLINKYNYTEDQAAKSLSKSFYVVSTTDGKYITNIKSKDDAIQYEKIGVNIKAVTPTGKSWGNIKDNSMTAAVLELNRDEIFTDKSGKKINTKYSPILNENFTECIFRPMDKIKIFMSSRFQGKSIDEEGIKSINEDTGYNPVFEGLISNVNISYSEGTISVNITAHDVTKWLDIGQFNVNPAIAFNKVDTLFQSLGIKPYDIAFAGMSLKDIVQTLILGYTKEWIEIPESQYNSAKSTYQSDEEFKKMFKVVDSYVDNPPVPNTSELNKIRSEAINKTFERLKVQLKVKGLNYEILIDNDKSKRKPVYAMISKTELTLQDIDTIIVNENLDADKVRLSTTEINRIVKSNNASKTRKAYFIKSPEMDGVGDFRLLPKGEGLKPNQSAGIKEVRLETEFSKDKLWIDENISNFEPYTRSFNNFDLFNYSQGRRKKLEIIKEICAINEIEFFMDANGSLICKTPDYNLNPGIEIKNKQFIFPGTDYVTTETLKAFKYNDDRYLIKPQEIMEYTKNISDSNIGNYCIVQGSYEFSMNENALENTDWAYDSALCLNFGVRLITKNMPLLYGMGSSNARQIFAKSFMNRQNSKYKSINVTIPLRSECKLARTVAFLPSDEEINWNFASQNFNNYVNNLQLLAKNDLLDKIEVGYISQITHTWSPGSQCTTKLSLTNVRLWRQSFGTLSYTRTNVDDLQYLKSRIIDQENLVKADIKLYQGYLNQLATNLNKNQLRVGNPDGIMETKTKDAIKYFCSLYGLKYNDSDPLSPDVRTEIKIQLGI